jgi:signal transduction histidine kinase
VLSTQQHTEKEKLEIYMHIVDKYCSFEMDSSLHYAHKGIPLARKFKDFESLTFFYHNSGSAHCFKSNYDSAFVYFNLAKELAVDKGKKTDETNALSSIAFAYAKQGKYNLAMDYYLKALRIAEQEKCVEESVKVLCNLSEINRRLGNTETALKYIKQAEKECNIIKSKRDYRMSHIWNEYAFNYLNDNNLDMALTYAMKSDSISSDDHFVHICYANGILATIYLKKSNFDLALHYAQIAYERAEMLKDKNLYAYSGIVLSNIYMAQKLYPEAEFAALRIWKSDSTYIDESRVAAKNIALANIYMGNTEKAAYYLEKYSELNNQYSEKSFQTIVSDLAIKYETEKKELRIAALEKEKKLSYWLGVLGFTIFLLVITLLFVRQRIINQKRKLSEQKVKQLEQERQLVATQAVLDGETAERSRLARDLHDGLGGMLSVVKLNLKDMKQFAIIEGGDLEHFGNALNMLDQSINELRRVAHHIMPDSLMRYGLKVALEDFCHAIPGTQFQYLGENPRLDNRLEVLIYRCAHELINNAVKHAKATSINVQLLIDKNIVSLTVQDNGVGFDPQTTGSGIGLENIKTRLAVHNGKINIHSSQNEGTEISIEIEL